MIRAGTVPRLETLPRVLAAARTTTGRLALVGAFTALLGVLNIDAWWQTGVVLCATSLLPERRTALVAIAALCWIALFPPLRLDALASLAPEHAAERWLPLWPVAVALVWGFTAAWVSFGRRFPSSPIGRRPLLGLVAVLVALLLAAQSGLAGLGWFLVTASAMALGSYLWFFGYWISDSRAKGRRTAGIPAGYCRPFWGFTNVPFGKGAAYLERVEARTPDDLAVVQLKGLELLVWAAVLKVAARALRELLWGRGSVWLGIAVPTYETAFEHYLSGDPDPLLLRWLAVVLHFVFDIFDVTVMGHEFIAVCRMAGFNVFRNTYRPLTSTTIAEFYNRIYYYFKELLVTFFFYPTYLRYFKRHPRLRLFAATLSAAGLGNFVFHFLRDDREILELGMWDALIAYHVYAVYALVLGIAIGLSQLRARTRRQHHLTGWRKARAIAGVLSFYCVMSMFDVPTESHTILDYGSFFVSLFRP